MEDARSMMSQKFSQRSTIDSDLDNSNFSNLGGNSMRSGSFRVPGSRPEFQKSVESVASMGSNLAHHAKSLVGSIACASNNERTGQTINADHATEAWRGRRNAAAARAGSGEGKPAGATGQTMFRESVVTGTGSHGPRQVDV